MARLTDRVLDAISEALNARLAGGFGESGAPDELDSDDYDGPVDEDYHRASEWVAAERNRRALRKARRRAK